MNFTDQMSLIGKFYRSNFDAQMTMTELFTDQISDAMTKHFLFEFFDVF